MLKGSSKRRDSKSILRLYAAILHHQSEKAWIASLLMTAMTQRLTFWRCVSSWKSACTAKQWVVISMVKPCWDVRIHMQVAAVASSRQVEKKIYIYIDDIICLLVFEWYIALPMGWLYATVINRTCKKHNWWGAKDVPFTPCDGQIGLKGMALGNHRMCGPPTGMCGKLILTVEIRVKDLFKEEGIIFAGLCFVMSRWAIDDHCF